MKKNIINTFILILALVLLQSCNKTGESGGGGNSANTSSMGSSNDPPTYVGNYTRSCHADDSDSGVYLSSKLIITASQLNYVNSCFSDVNCSIVTSCSKSIISSESIGAYYTIISTDNSNKSKVVLSSCSISTDIPSASCFTLFPVDSNSFLYIQATATAINIFGGSSSNYVTYIKN